MSYYRLLILTFSKQLQRKQVLLLPSHCNKRNRQWKAKQVVNLLWSKLSFCFCCICVHVRCIILSCRKDEVEQIEGPAWKLKHQSFFPTRWKRTLRLSISPVLLNPLLIIDKMSSFCQGFCVNILSCGWGWGCKAEKRDSRWN